MDHQTPIESARWPKQDQSHRKLSAQERLAAALQQDNQRMDGWLPSLRPEPYRPDKQTSRANRAQIAGKRWERVNDLYIVVLYIAILGAFLTGIVNFLGSSLVDVEGSATRQGFAVIQTESLLAALSLIAVSWIGRLAKVLGPVAVDQAQAEWWLSLPVRTAPFLRRGLIGRLATAMFLGVVAWLCLTWGVSEASPTQISANPVGVLSAALSSGLTVLLLLAASGLAQTLGRRLQLRQLWSVIPVLVIAVLIVEAIGTAFGAWPVGTAFLWFISPAGLFSLAQQGGSAAVALPSALALLAGLVTCQALARIERVQHADLIDAGASSAHLSGVMTLLESRNINSALLGGNGPGITTPTSKKRLPRPRHPVIAWARADFLVLSRSPAARRATLMGFGIILLVVFSEPGRSVILLCVAVFLGALLAVRGLTAATDEIADQPGLQRLLPLGHQAAWVAHTIAPAVMLLPWGILVGTVTGWAIHGPANPAAWSLTVLIAAISTLALAASTVRMSVRPSVEWGSVLQATQASHIFSTVTRSVVHGVDTALLAVLPLALALTLTHLTPWYLLFSVATSLIAWCIAVHVPEHRDALQ